MPGIIRADTDQLRAVANQMRTTAEQISTGTGSMQQSMEMLDMVWSGKARDRGMEAWARIVARYNPEVNTLLHLAKELEALAQRMDEAAAVFGDSGSGSGGGTAGGIGEGQEKPWYEDKPKLEQPPQNMGEIFDLLGPDKNNGNEIQIYQVGPNEFAVLLQGSDQSRTGINSLWTDAPEAGFGGDTEYARKVREMLQELGEKHPGAAVNLFGYSLGGIVAQQVASNTSFFNQNGLNLKTVSTYGAPKIDTVPEGKTYADFDAPGDIVSGLPVSVTPESVLTTVAFGLKPGETLAVGGAMHMTGYQHDFMPTRQDMNNTTPPFNADTWVLVDSYNDATDYGAQADENIGDIVQDTGKSIGETIKDTGQKIGDQAEKIGQEVQNKVQEGKEQVDTYINKLGAWIPDPF
ncbi:WXG100 family type VII secretion target [Candidatus Chloroploca sp. Khr17]|uniref:WXG100 family type VII secretion target n=1 Tax=Candidatus Chloroploca sp. Khr17 TaxID=2496869 RepID=UPI00101BCD76|nr:WXG100 family type VII secretion target [Candidatus Chloroploca sp. Khr17]